MYNITCHLITHASLLYPNLQVVALKKIPKKSRNDKPVRIPLPHPLYESEGVEICLFVKDNKGEGHKEAKNRIKEQKISGVSKVIGISKLKSKYESHEAKRALCNSYDLFVADDRIIPSLPKLIGKSFFTKKKQPVPVRLDGGRNWATAIQKACEATYMFSSSGSSLDIKVAKSGQTEEQCVENVLAAIKGAAEKVPRQWLGIKALYLKTAESVALPIYKAQGGDDDEKKEEEKK
jgi:ribosome biogenesis protein UTP30